MFNPKYRVLVTSKCFPHDKVICLGSQLISIVNFIKDMLPKHFWYGADINAVGKDAMRFNVNDVRLNIIGTDSQFTEYCSQIDQFICGVFLCIDSNYFSQNIQEIQLETEDERFRSISCDGILLEIRTFDTTYFQLYSEDLTIMKKLSDMYHVKIEEKGIYSASG